MKLVTDSSESLAGRISKMEVSGKLDIKLNYSEKMEEKMVAMIVAEVEG